MADTSSAGTTLKWTDRLLELAFDPLVSLFFSRMAGGVGAVILFILVLVCSHQLTPGEEWVVTGWPAWVYYVAVGSAGGVVGFLGASRRVVGVVAGAAVAVGALAAVALLHAWLPEVPVKRVWAWATVIATVVGMVPGVAFYGVVDKLLPPPGPDPHTVETRLQRRRRERGLPAKGEQQDDPPTA